MGIRKRGSEGVTYLDTGAFENVMCAVCNWWKTGAFDRSSKPSEHRIRRIKQ